MIIALALAAALATTPVDAERSYAAMAQTKGQWTAFRATAAPDALMFVPEPVNAMDWLKGRADPAVAVMWWPSRSWTSCDGKLGVNFGPWLRKGGTLAGTFTTVWTKGPDGGWKWLLDRGSVSPHALSAGEKVESRRPVCRNLAKAHTLTASPAADADPLVLIGDDMPQARVPGNVSFDGKVLGSGASPDGTLRWEVRAMKADTPGSHILEVWSWDGSAHRLAVLETTDPLS
jgi:hypothetical protein